MSEVVAATAIAGINSDNELVALDGSIIGQIIIGSQPAHDVDTGFILLSAYLVFFMQAGFAFLSAGSVRAKNAKTIILKNLLDSCFGAVCFFCFGFAFAYGGDYDEPANLRSGNNFIGHKHFALVDLPRNTYAFWFFQYAFAAAASSIVSGAVEERMKFNSYLGYVTYLTSFVYPVVAHWVWSSTGWLGAFKTDGAGNPDRLLGTGMVDFAGCGVVHMVGGFTALVAAKILGPRIGRFDAEGNAQTIPGHSASLTLLGVFLLWFGWYGFNPGSALTIVNNSEVAAMAAVNTTLSAACATISSLIVFMLVELAATGRVMWDLIGCSNGSLAGLVAITASCGFVEPWAAILIGTISGALYVGASSFVVNVLKIDDPLDAVAVHGANGVWGLLAAASFASKEGIAAVYGRDPVSDAVGEDYGFIMGGNGNLLACALIGILVIFAWTVVTMVPFFYTMNMLGWLRVAEADEVAGLDVSHHGGSAYHGETELNAKDIGDGAAGGMSHKGGDHEARRRIADLESANQNLLRRMEAIENKRAV